MKEQIRPLGTRTYVVFVLFFSFLELNGTRIYVNQHFRLSLPSENSESHIQTKGFSFETNMEGLI